MLVQLIGESAEQLRNCKDCKVIYGEIEGNTYIENMFIDNSPVKLDTLLRVIISEYKKDIIHYPTKKGVGKAISFLKTIKT